jgi:hypothetical protein
MKRMFLTLFILFSFSLSVPAQPGGEKIDKDMVEKIKKEGFENSKVMEYMSYLTDVYGPRLTWSPEYKRGADWVAGELKNLGLTNVMYDEFEPMGRGWTLNRFSAHMTEPLTTPLMAYPKAWSPGTDGTVRGKAVRMDIKKEEDLEAYEGKLKNAFVFMSDPRDIKAHFEPQGTRLSDSELLEMANAGESGARMRRMMGDSSALQRYFERISLNAKVLEFVQDEGAAVLIDASRGDGGTIFVGSATVPRKVTSLNDLFGGRAGAYNPDAPKIMPQVTMAAEHYNRIIRMLEKNEDVELEMNIDVNWTKAVPGFNIIAEIPGTDLSDEIVMIGGHFDTWHSGTGATDNASGTAVCLEALRILQKSGLKPRRTIRIGLWGGEEQGLYGSREYVKEYLAAPKSDDLMAMFRGGAQEIDKKAGYEKFSVYFNNDNGTGRVRGVYMQGNHRARPFFSAWLEAAGDETAKTLTIQNTSGTDHLAFDGVGLPGFQFIQDPVEYDTRTHHSNMDVYERIQEEDVKQGAVMMAIFAYQAAMRDGLFPRKPAAPQRARRAASSSNN